MAYRSVDDLEPLLIRLKAVADLNDDDVGAIRSLPFTVRAFGAGWDVLREGDCPTQTCIVLMGVCCRSKILGNGARQIVSVHIPGDLPDLQSLHLASMDYNLSTLTSSRIAFVPHRYVHQLMQSNIRLAQLLSRELIIDGSIYREWICNIGRRSAHMRLAHFVCEMFVRYSSVRGNDGMKIPFAFTQADLSDAQGMSKIHINRTLKYLKDEGLISIAARTLTINDWPRLQQLGDFNIGYLHLPRSV